MLANQHMPAAHPTLQATSPSEAAASQPSRAGSQSVVVGPWEVQFSDLVLKHPVGAGSFGTARASWLHMAEACRQLT